METKIDAGNNDYCKAKLGNVRETSKDYSQSLLVNKFSLFFAKSRKVVEKVIFQTKNRGNEREDPRKVVGMV